jgi:hypothetical protein
MNTAAILIIVVAILVVALLLWMRFRKEHTKRLRARFGPEYDRTIEQHGSAAKAERDLEKRENRMRGVTIRSLTPGERDQFSDRWQLLQSRFVDDPSAAIRDAERLIVEIMTARGYPMLDFEGRAEDLSVDHPVVVSNYRLAHSIAAKQANGAASTEELRQAVVCYRDLYEELLERPLASRVPAHSDH